MKTTSKPFMAQHTAFLCLVAELAQSGLVDKERLGHAIREIGDLQAKADSEYGGLISQIGDDVLSLGKTLRAD